MSDITRHAYHYTERLSLALVPIPSGLKGPRAAGWNKEENTIRTGAEAKQTFGGQALNMGVLHSASDTGTLDIDHAEWAGLALAAIGYNLAELQQWPVRIKGKNGEKPFFQMGGLRFDRHSIAWPHPTQKQADKDGNPTNKPRMVTLFELRAGPIQDVLPPSIHPDTGKPYEWAGTPPRSRADIPLISDELRALWENWEEYAAKMQAACPWYTAPTPTKYAAFGNAISIKGERPGDHFRARVHITVVLLRNGYKQKGERFLPPGSSGTVAGVRILRGDDGVDRAFSDHGSCPLNNDHAHDSFSALAILEHGGDIRAAARAAAAELGLPNLATNATGYTLEQVRQMWEAASVDLFRQGGMVLDAIPGNHHMRNALIELWAVLTQIAPTCLHPWQGGYVINFGGLTRLKAYGVTGRNSDITARLKQLTELGYLLKVVKEYPEDMTSSLLLSVPADPLTLGMMRLSKEGAEKKALTLETKRMRRPAQADPKVCTRLPYSKNALLRIGEPSTHFRFSGCGLNLLYLLCGAASSVSELASIRGKSPPAIRKQIRKLEDAEVVARKGHTLTASLTWKQFLDFMRLTRESDSTIRFKVLRALEKSEGYAYRRAFCAPSFVPPRELAKRKRVWNFIHDRVERVKAGEPLREVLRLAA